MSFHTLKRIIKTNLKAFDTKISVDHFAKNSVYFPFTLQIAHSHWIGETAEAYFAQKPSEDGARFGRRNLLFEK